MSWLAALTLNTLHLLHQLWTILLALLYYPFLANPQSLQTYRSKLPKTLSLVLASVQETPSEEECDAIVESVVRAVHWCRIAGVNGLCVYDRHGLVVKLSSRITAALHYGNGDLLPESECSSDGSDTEYSASPQLTDFTDSRAISPETWCSPPSIIRINLDSDPPHAQSTSYQRKQVTSHARKPLKKSSHIALSLISYYASKPLLASIAQSFATSNKAVEGAYVKGSEEFGVSVERVDRMVYELLRLPAPDLMIVHPVKQYALPCPALELHGFPPWLMKLTEIYYDERPSLSRVWHNRSGKRNFAPLSEENFRRALDCYSRAEMRLGK